MARKMLRFVEKRGVHAARNRPSEDRKCWQRFELRIHGLKSWGRNWWRKVRETRSPFSDSRQERPNHLQDKGLGCTPPRSVGGGLRGTGSGGNLLWGSMRDHGRGIRNLEPRWNHRTGPTSLLHAPNSIRQFSRPLRTSGRWVKVRCDAVTARLSGFFEIHGLAFTVAVACFEKRSREPGRPPRSRKSQDPPNPDAGVLDGVSGLPVPLRE